MPVPRLMVNLMSMLLLMLAQTLVSMLIADVVPMVSMLPKIPMPMFMLMPVPILMIMHTLVHALGLLSYFRKLYFWWILIFFQNFYNPK